MQGKRCDQCKPGHFALHQANPRGCLRCFCYGVTDQCEAAHLGVERMELEEGWMASDLRGTVRVAPFWSELSEGVTVAEEDMTGAGARAGSTYFWEAPREYAEVGLVSYGLKLVARMKWHRGRGDTAGTFTRCPDIVLVVRIWPVFE